MNSCFKGILILTVKLTTGGLEKKCKVILNWSILHSEFSLLLAVAYHSEGKDAPLGCWAVYILQRMDGYTEEEILSGYKSSKAICTKITQAI